MIPTEDQILRMWDTYDLPQQKRIHVRLVARVAMKLAERIIRNDTSVDINKPLLYASAMLHDIDKNVPKLSGEQHPDAGVRVLREVHMPEVASVIKTHALHMILNPDNAPKSIEEKILFIADKMVKYEIISIDKRFALWRSEENSPEMKRILDESYPKVKALEEEILTLCGLQKDDVATIVKQV